MDLKLLDLSLNLIVFVSMLYFFSLIKDLFSCDMMMFNIMDGLFIFVLNVVLVEIDFGKWYLFGLIIFELLFKIYFLKL